MKPQTKSRRMYLDRDDKRAVRGTRWSSCLRRLERRAERAYARIVIAHEMAGHLD